MKRITLLFLVYCLIPFSSYCQWSWSHPTPTGNALTQLSFINNATGWIAGNGGTLLKTTNGGSSWTSQFAGHLDKITGLEFPDSLNGFMSASSELYVSINSGQSWSIRFRFPSKTITALFFLNADTGLVAVTDFGGNTEIQRTLNGGNNWTVVSTFNGSSINDIEINASGNGLACGTNGQMLRSVNYGLTWNPVTIGGAGNLTSVSIAANQVVYCIDEFQVYKSTDSGNTFSGIGSPGAGAVLKSVSFRNQNNGAVSCAGGQIYSTTDGGSNWSLYNGNPITDLMAISYTGTNTIYSCGTVGEIVKSSDGGQNWNNLNARSTEAPLRAVDAVSANTAYAAGLAGTILKTTNTGLSWTAQVSNAGGEDLFDIAMANANTGVAVGSNGTIVRTTDGGANWDFIFSGIGETLFGVASAGSGKMYVCGANGKFAFSNNNGNTWTDAPTSFTGLGYDFTSIQCLGPDTIFMCTNQPYLVSTYDGGISWNLLTIPSSFECTSAWFRNGLTGWVGTLIGEIYKTTDGGNTWTLDFEEPSANAIEGLRFSGTQNGWFFCGELIYRTGDGGQVWGREINPNNDPLNDIDFFSGNNAIAVSEGLGGIIIRSNDIQLSLPSFSLCTDNTYTFTVNAIGTWQPGNQFRVELSDEFGEFIFPLVLGSVSATGSSPVLVNVPNGLIDGTDYRVRVFSTNPPMWSTLNTTPVSINTSPDAFIIAGGPTSFCQGSSVTLYALTNIGWTYQWFKDGIQINGATADTLFVTQTGNYTVRVDDGTCNLTSPITDVLVINCAGISESSENSNYRAFPNPTQNLLRVERKTNTSIDSYRILDLSGRILEENRPVWDDNGFMIDLSTYPPGMYLIQIIGDNPATIRVSRN